MGKESSRSMLSAMVACLLLAVAPAGHATGSGATASVRLVNPDSVGFSSERLQRLDSTLQRLIEDRQYAGFVTLVARHGQVVHFSSLGKQDLQSGVNLGQDAIF